ncbi:glycosyltransferase family 2 protein [Hymenobacter arizonensis]|uniref:Glycosyl transferase family 2 n=1 Tax=Hymenobacter arizonensis TaxID=1227077 RepID=A0A1I6BTR4_HYMAR|nr:glycosyltransferase family 2 protein [Hymenobacter arizonensis]SFQ84316.1 Glycosyl transferase family 2 [Hymenobacter arizonensis]
MNKVVTTYEKVLSLVIPTYNRGEYLDNQLAWAIKSVNNKWDKVELIVCDNASTDTTHAVCEKWGALLRDKIKVFRNEENVGLVGNCLLGLKRAAGKYVWLIGDDDPIADDAVSIVLNTINENPNLNLIHINHRCISGLDGSIVQSKFYNLDTDICTINAGAKELSNILQSHNTGGLMFITANVIERAKALDFIKNNPPEEKLLLVYPMFLNAGLASTGPFYLIAKCLIDCVYHTSSWMSELEYVQHVSIPKTLIKLHSKGISSKALRFCIDYQYKDLPTARDVFYRLRTDHGYWNKFHFKPWAYKWVLKNYLKWQL